MPAVRQAAFIRNVMVGREGLTRAVLVDLAQRAGGARPRSYLSTGNLTTPRSPFGYYFRLSGFDTLADSLTANGPDSATNQRKVMNPIDYALTFSGTWLDI